MRFRTYAHFDDPDLNLNRGYGLIEVAYNGSVVNSTFMGSKMRGGIDMDPKAIVVRYDDGFEGFSNRCLVRFESGPRLRYALGLDGRCRLDVVPRD